MRLKGRDFVHKSGKWARQILALQDGEGKWGCFHSLSGSYGEPLTTEQSLRRLQRLGYTIEDGCIQRAVGYMEDCLVGRKAIPDRREKVQDWDVFTALMLAAWIRRFTADCPAANAVAKKWAGVITGAFDGGGYCHDRYMRAYRDTLGTGPKGGRLIDFVNFYPLSLVSGCLDAGTEKRMAEYVLGHEEGIYYIYEKRLRELPPEFASREASRYLAAMELLAAYPGARPLLGFVAEWLKENRGDGGKWDLGSKANDKVYFPLSDDWRRRETREADCTERIGALLEKLRAV